MLGLAACAPMARPRTADLLVVGGTVWTGAPGAPDAEALAVREGRVLAVGRRAEVERWRGPATVVLHVGGGFVAPGFIDSHVHFLAGGLALLSVQLRDARTPEAFVARIRDAARRLPPGTWILGGDWDHTQWGGRLPDRAWIDSVTPQHPVWVRRLDGHMALANSLALRRAGIDRATPDVPGGEIVRDGRGEPTGVLKDNAMALVDRVVPEPTAAQLDQALEAAMTHVARFGVTTVVHMGTWEDVAVFRRARAAGRLRTRVVAAVPLATWARLRDTVAAHGLGDDWLRLGLLKGFADGSLGSHTALFHEPYTDDPRARGLQVTPTDSLYAWILGADRAGLQVAVHAIGDAANTLVLDLFARIAREHGPRDRRFRIEHAQHLRPSDIPRFAALGVIASAQPYHAIDDGRWADSVIGPERAQTTYAFRSLLDAGARLAFGSDWFVAPPDPLAGVYAAVTRRTLDGRHPEGWVPSQKISAEEALAAYTREAAYAIFADGRLGVLRPGAWADFVVLEADPRRVPPDRLGEVRVRRTVVGGRTVYDAAEASAEPRSPPP